MEKKIIPFVLLLSIHLALFSQQLDQSFASKTVPTGFTINSQALTTDNLPSGTIVLRDFTYNVEKELYLHFAGNNREDLLVTENSAGFKATKLGFLHTFQPGLGVHEWRLASALAHRKIELPPINPVVFYYKVEYADGSSIDVPVRFAESIDQWYRVHNVAPMLWAQEAFVKPMDEVTGEKTAVYSMEWPNPYPEKAITKISVLPQDEPHMNFGDALILSLAVDNTPASGSTYYVDPSPKGSDENPGTIDEPWGDINYALSQMKPGDNLYLRGGLYALNRQILIEDFGEIGKWTTISAFPGETPILDGFGVLFNLDKYRTDAMSRPFPHEEGIIAGKRLTGYLRIQGLQIQNSRRAGISLFGEAIDLGKNLEKRAQFVDVLFNRIDRTNEMSIIIHHADDVRVNGNIACRGHSEQMSFDFLTGKPGNRVHHEQEAVDLSRNTRFEIAYNMVYGSGKEAIDCISVSDGLIHNNYVHSSLNGIYIDSWSIPIERLDIYNNYIHDAFSGIPLSTEGSNQLVDINVHHNIVFKSKGNALSVTEATYKANPTTVRDIAFYNNTVDSSNYHYLGINWHGSGIYVRGFEDNKNFRDIIVANNIVTNDAMMPIATVWDDYEDQDITITHNLLYPAEDRMPERLQSRSTSFKFTKGENAIETDPLFKNPARGDYRITQNSPAIGEGVKIENGKITSKRANTDLGALPYGSEWLPGFDWAGQATAYYTGEKYYRTIDINMEKFTIHRNHLQRPSWFQTGRYGPDLQHLPAGKHLWAGIEWFIEEDNHNDQPTILALKGYGSESKAEKITGIEINRKAHSLAFLQTFHANNQLRQTDENIALYEYVVYYTDGTQETVPVHWKEDTDYWRGDRKDLPNARLAFTTMIEQRRNDYNLLKLWGDEFIRLYSLEWENPHPDKVITTVDIVRVADEQMGSPAVFAISTGHKH